MEIQTARIEADGLNVKIWINGEEVTDDLMKFVFTAEAGLFPRVEITQFVMGTDK
jgi:hypothetical protein